MQFPAKDPWFLKIEDGSVFKASDFAELRRWAAEGRVAPSGMVSSDGTAWCPAPEVSGLEMVWKVHLPEGSLFGPLHIGAVIELMGDGFFPPDGLMEHIQTGASMALRQYLADLVVSGSAVPTLTSERDAALEQARSEAVSERDQRERASRVSSERLSVLEERLRVLALECGALKESASALISERDAALAVLEQARSEAVSERDQRECASRASSERLSVLEDRLRVLALECGALKESASVLISERDAALAALEQARSEVVSERNLREREYRTGIERISLLEDQLRAAMTERAASRSDVPESSAQRVGGGPAAPLGWNSRAWCDGAAAPRSSHALSGSPRETVVEPEVVRDVESIRDVEPDPGCKALSSLHALEVQAQTELAQWQQLNMEGRKMPVRIRQWFNRKAEGGDAR